MMNNTYKFKLQDDGRDLMGPGASTLTVYHTADGHQYVMLTAHNIAPALSEFTVDGEPVRHEDMMQKLLGGKAGCKIALVIDADLVEVTQATK